MSLKPITASQLKRIKACPGSQHLPHVNESSAAAERGTAVHQFLEDCAAWGRAKALSKVPDKYRDICESIDVGEFEWLTRG